MVSVSAVCTELGVVMSPKELAEFVKWFDTNGSDMLDYNELTRQLFGEDIQTRSVRLPKVPHAEIRSQVLAVTTKPAAYFGLGASAISTMALGMGTNSPTKVGETNFSMTDTSAPVNGQLKMRTLMFLNIKSTRNILKF